MTNSSAKKKTPVEQYVKFYQFAALMAGISILCLGSGLSLVILYRDTDPPTTLFESFFCFIVSAVAMAVSVGLFAQATVGLVERSSNKTKSTGFGE